MRNKIKILLSVFSILIFLVILNIQTFAADDNIISGYSMLSDDEDKITVVVSISGNTGIMGFGINVKYPSDILKNPAVSRGSVTSEGMLNDSINDATNGTFNVIWNNTGNVSEDGTIFLINFEVYDKDKIKSEEIELSYSKQDTFNSEWKDVSLNCQKIILNEESKSEMSTKSSYNIDIESVDSGYIKTIIDEALEKQDADNISNLDETEFAEFKEDIEQSLSIYGCEDNVQTMNRDDIEKLYVDASESSYIEKTLLERDGGDIISAVDNAVKSIEKDNIESISADEAEKFISVFSEEMNSDANVEELPKNLSATQKLETVKKLYEKATRENSPENMVESKLSTNRYYIIYICIAIIFIGILTFIVMNKNKKQKRGGVKNEAEN